MVKIESVFTFSNPPTLDEDKLKPTSTISSWDDQPDEIELIDIQAKELNFENIEFPLVFEYQNEADKRYEYKILFKPTELKEIDGNILDQNDEEILATINDIISFDYWLFARWNNEYRNPKTGIWKIYYYGKIITTITGDENMGTTDSTIQVMQNSILNMSNELSAAVTIFSQGLTSESGRAKEVEETLKSSLQTLQTELGTLSEKVDELSDGESEIVDDAIEEHDSDTQAHTDIRRLIETEVENREESIQDISVAIEEVKGTIENDISEMQVVIAASNAVINGLNPIKLEGNILKREIAGVTSVLKTLIPADSILTLNKTMIYDDAGTSGVYSGNIDDDNISVTTLSFTFTGDDSPLLLKSSTTQVIESDLTMKNGKKFLVEKKNNAHAVAVFVGEYSDGQGGIYEQIEIGTESDPLCLNHNAKSETDGVVVGPNIIVNYKDVDGTNKADALAYLSNLQVKYQNEETLTNQIWIDNKGIYRQVISTTLGAAEDVENTIATISDIETMIPGFPKGTLTLSDGTQLSIQDNPYVSISMHNGNIIEQHSDADYNDIQIVMIVEYTKVN